MWNDGWTHEMMGGAYGGWHWLFSFHGFLSIVFVGVIVFAVVALVRDLRGRGDGSPTEAMPDPGHGKGGIGGDKDEYAEPKRHLKA